MTAVCAALIQPQPDPERTERAKPTALSTKPTMSSHLSQLTSRPGLVDARTCSMLACLLMQSAHRLAMLKPSPVKPTVSPAISRKKKNHPHQVLGR